ncbi:hypothetical protein CRG98_011567 [Punica granatum]|uniref:Reverse transcriptase n=1 Tax=Punica granatum TaxID=22663 RepID=A0A2I0KHN5_PUNGR|nr:hypothetical protein CRG98_011567 [Punica granatum]
MAGECPTKAKLVALVKADEEKEEETRLGSLRILSSITTRKANRSKGLMFADVEIVGKAFSALVDTGASDLFISEEGAKKLGLRIEMIRGRLKMVNSKEVPTCGVAKDVDIWIGLWSRKETIEIIPLDDYDFIIGMDFLDRTDALLVPFADCICVLDVKCQCVVLVDEDVASRDDVPAEVAQVLDSFKDVMPTELPKKLPPNRKVDHRIELVPDAKLPTMAPYRIAPPKLVELRKQLKELLDAGYVRPLKAPFGALVLFQKKHDGSLRMCVDYRALNKLTVKNKVLHPFLDRFVVVYLDDIVVYSQPLEDHIEHLRQVFEVLRENSLYVKREKCAFAKSGVHFLGHIVDGGRVRMDPLKGYSSIIVPLTDLLKKARAWKWTDECQAAFDCLKRVITEEPVLALPCYGKSFEVETDASDFAIGDVLIQDGYPIAFESRKLSDIERRWEILWECHDSKRVGHPGIHLTSALIEERYYWPQLRDDVETFVKTCLVCQQDKTEQKSPARLLEPLPIPDRSWESVLMDFIVNFPKSEGCQTLMVAVDRIREHMVKYWGVLTTIVSDRDPRFMGRFWTELFKLLGMSLNFSTSLYPQTDGLMERVNALLELYLRHYVSTTRKDWATMIDATQFSYNLQRRESTGKSSFEILMGQQLSTPSTVASGYKGNSLAAYKLAKSWQEEADLARSCLNRATKRMKKWSDKKRRHVEYNVGDLVLVELPKKLKLHAAFHVSMLKPFQEDKEDPNRAESLRAPIGAKAAYDRDVEQILADRVVRKRWCKPKREYFIKWKGLPESEASWEPAEDLWQFTK